MKTRAQASDTRTNALPKKNGSRAKARRLTDEEIERDHLGPLFQDMAKFIFDRFQLRSRVEAAVGEDVATAAKIVLTMAFDRDNMTEERTHTISKAIQLLASRAVQHKPHLSQDWLALADSLTAIRRAAVSGVLVRSPLTRHRFATRGWSDNSPVALFNWVTRSMWFQRHTMLNNRLNRASERFLTQASERMQREWAYLEQLWPGLKENPPRLIRPRTFTPDILANMQETITILSATPGNFDTADHVDDLKRAPESVYAVLVGVRNRVIPSARDRMRNFYASIRDPPTIDNVTIQINDKILDMFFTIMESRITRRREYIRNEETRRQKIAAKNWQDTPYENYKTPDLAYGVEGWRKHILRLTAYMNAAAMEYSGIPKPQSALKRYYSVVADTVTFMGTVSHIGAHVLDQRAKTTAFVLDAERKERLKEAQTREIESKIITSIIDGNEKLEGIFQRFKPTEDGPASPISVDIYNTIVAARNAPIPGLPLEPIKWEGQQTNGTQITELPTKRVSMSQLTPEIARILTEKTPVVIRDSSVVNNVILPPNERAQTLITMFEKEAHIFSRRIEKKSSDQHAKNMQEMTKKAEEDLQKDIVANRDAMQSVMMEILIQNDRVSYWLLSGLKYLGLDYVKSGIASIAQFAKAMVFGEDFSHPVWFLNLFFTKEALENGWNNSMSSIASIAGLLWATFYFYYRKGLGMFGSIVMVVLQCIILACIDDFLNVVLVSIGTATGVFLAQKLWGGLSSFYKWISGRASEARVESGSPAPLDANLEGWISKIGNIFDRPLSALARYFGLESFYRDFKDIIYVGGHGVLGAIGLVSFSMTMMRYVNGITKSIGSLYGVACYAAHSRAAWISGAALGSAGAITASMVYKFYKNTIAAYAKRHDVRAQVGAIFLERPDLTLAGMQMVLMASTLALSVFSDDSYMVKKLYGDSGEQSPADEMFNFVGMMVAVHFPWFRWNLPHQIGELIGTPKDPLQDVVYPLISCTDESVGKCEVVRQIAIHQVYNFLLSSWTGAEDFLVDHLIASVKSVIQKHPEDFVLE